MIICGITYRKAAIYQPPSANKSYVRTVKEAGFTSEFIDVFDYIKKNNLKTKLTYIMHKTPA